MRPPRYSLVGGVLAAILAGSGARADDAAPPLDPTRPPGAETIDPAAVPAGPEPIYVSAVFHFATQWVAVVNGRALTVGDRIAHAEIVSIDKDGIEYRRGKAVHAARLHREYGRSRATSAGDDS